MNWMEVLNQIFQTCIVPLLGIVVAMIIRAVNAKKSELSASTDNQITQKYINLLASTITDCVIATNQTYVDALKEQNAFTKEAQEEALSRTYHAVIAILSAEARKYLENIYGDLNAYILTKIEAEVNINKV